MAKQKIFYSEQQKQAISGGSGGGNRRRGKAAKATSSQAKPLSKIPIPSVGTKITKKPIINAGRGNNGTPSNVVVRKVKLIKTGQDNTKVSGGNNNRKPTMAILKNIQSYVKQNIVKPVQSESITASKPKAMTRVGVPKKGGANNAVQTAAAIASNPAHPRSKDVRELLNSYEKGWVEEHKFKELLQGMVV